MRKNAFTIIEVAVVFLLILGVSFLIVPKSMDTTKQARFISKWTEKYADLEYMFSVIQAQQGEELAKEFNKKKDISTNSANISELFKPYLRISSELKPNGYHQKYMNGTNVLESDKYYFNKFYLTNTNEIVSFKWIKDNCDDDICAIMSFDINGEELPNKWGYDIYGINVTKNKIEPLGKGFDTDTMRCSCSKSGYGLYCSYYYLIGGKFD